MGTATSTLVNKLEFADKLYCEPLKNEQSRGSAYGRDIRIALRTCVQRDLPQEVHPQTSPRTGHGGDLFAGPKPCVVLCLPSACLSLKT